MIRNIVMVAILGVCFSISPDVSAKTNRELTYRYNQIWGTVIRFLRVDNGFKIVEKDKTDGYIMFEYRDGERTFNSTLELVEVEIEGRIYIRTGLRVQNMPSYVEVLLQDKLQRKLRDEYGDPPPARAVERDPAPSDEKSTSDEESSEDETPDDGKDAQSEKSKEE